MGAAKLRLTTEVPKKPAFSKVVGGSLVSSSLSFFPLEDKVWVPKPKDKKEGKNAARTGATSSKQNEKVAIRSDDNDMTTMAPTQAMHDAVDPVGNENTDQSLQAGTSSNGMPTGENVPKTHPTDLTCNEIP
ncbi:hypothetical protein L6452_18944 [Arctium lappa]|uniref:Uncharacterized protein n=1 Tax=Arctium lappa TaxID=4217 RepID=A0ACB9B6H9_ARCLA|nr:hypothetical protein L6452_18944 [Arctium lappa]